MPSHSYTALSELAGVLEAMAGSAASGVARGDDWHATDSVRLVRSGVDTHCETCGEELDKAVFIAQKGLCRACVPECDRKSAVIVDLLVLNAQAVLPDDTVDLIGRVKIEDADCSLAVVQSVFDLVVIQGAIDDQRQRNGLCMSSSWALRYADVMFRLRTVVPVFPVANSKPKTYTRTVLNVTQDKFEEVVKRFATPPESEESAGQVLCQLTTLVSFIGHLYVRKLLAARVMAQVVHDLIGVRDRLPHKNLVYCVIELMHIIGRTLDANEEGYKLMTQFLARLENLAATTTTTAGMASTLYPQHVQASVCALRTARNDAWPNSQLLEELCKQVDGSSNLAA